MSRLSAQFNEEGTLPIIILVVVIGLILFTLISANFPFKDQKFNQLYQKPLSFASTNAFVTKNTSGDLILNGQKFKAIGPNIPWLALDEFSGVNYPSNAQIDEGLDDAVAMGATTIRSHAALSVGCPKCIQPTLGQFNNAAFTSLDYAIKGAKDRNLRLILPLTDTNCGYFQGSRCTYLSWRGLPTGTSTQNNEFYKNTTVIADFKKHINTVLNHLNPLTGLAYKDDPTIMAWETGNEMSTYPDPWDQYATDWTLNIAQYIKSIAPSQLVLDGHYGLDSKVLDSPFVDITSDHSYDDYRSPDNIKTWAAQAQAKGKAFLVGEFDWQQTSGVRRLQDLITAFEDTNVDGDFYWQLLPNNGGVGDYAVFWPSSNSNINLLSDHAHRMCPASCVTNLGGSAATPSPSPSTTPGFVTIDDYITGTSLNQFNYVGVGWQSDTTNHWDSTTNDFATFSFNGTQIKLYAILDTHHGMATITLDNGAPTTVDLFATTRQAGVLVYTSPTLTAGNHILKVVVSGTKNPASTGTTINIDKVDYFPTNATPTPSPLPIKAGDIDGNNKVDIFDYNILLTNFGKKNQPGVLGDLDNDGDVDIFDYNIVLTNFGR